ncbi:MAG: response regulator [Betaproteobacteria bacterium]|nr:response regulator [Betaproteobacteria bacterium]
MSDTKKSELLSGWGLISRLMLAVGIAIVVGGSVQTLLLVAEGASENSGRLRRDLQESLTLISPLIADQALVGEYAAIEQLLKNQVKKVEVDSYEWTDKDGRKILAQDYSEKLAAPVWFTKLASVEAAEGAIEVTAGGVSYGSVFAKMTPNRAYNRLWTQFTKQLQIVIATLLLLLQLIWLIFRGNLGTLRMLAEGANRFAQGDHSVRIKATGAAEIQLAAEAFNNMATNTENLLASLSESESKNRLLATIVEQSSEAIWTMDRAGIVTSWNAGAAVMFGYAAEEAVGQPLTMSQASAAEAEERTRRLVAGERFSYDTKAITKRGEMLDIQVAVAPLIDEANECIGTIGVARDVTKNKRGEETLRVAHAAAESASQAKSSFLARMSHEIRTPMNGVLGMTELLLDTDLTSVQRKYAKIVQTSGENLLAIINDVLDFSKIEAGKLELEQIDMDVRTVVEDVIGLLAERAESKGLELACDLPADLPTRVKGDPLRLAQILTNLAGNAVKFTQRGGVVISVSALGEAGSHITLQFDVTDTGPGVPEDAQIKIFDEFSQADGSTTRQFGGSGLGLAISRQLVEMMGGTIHVRSAVGAGSTFWFTCLFEKRTQVSGDDYRKVSGILAGKRALIVDSADIGRGILHSQVDSWGMNTRIVESAPQALTSLTQATAAGMPFDLAIIDLSASGADSIALTRSIRANRAIAGTRLVMLSPVGNHALVKEAQLAGIDACLVKPIRQSELYESLVNLFSDAAHHHAQALSRKDIAPAIASGRASSLLLVEDNIINRGVAIAMLRKIKGIGHVVVAANGREALDKLSGRAFDLVLMDCHMPEMDGFEATKAIRQREEATPGVRLPIVALTANAMAQDRQDCLDAGMDDHLSKPFSRAQLEDMLDRWLPESPIGLGGPPASAGDSSTVLDEGVLEQLRELQDTDTPNVVAELIQLYLFDSQKLIDRLHRAADAVDSADLALAAHTLKASSANIGATRLSGLCNALDVAARESRREVIPDLLAQVADEHAAVRTALNDELVAGR